MEIQVIRKINRVYKFDDPCFACDEDEIFKHKLLCDEVEGLEINVSHENESRIGFVCLDHFNEMKNDPRFIVKE